MLILGLNLVELYVKPRGKISSNLQVIILYTDVSDYLIGKFERNCSRMWT
jgi:hypothetical protein